ncbi:MAG: RagB/SusD family nutrient uptake outer membrane protein [Saprospiraceae bacterium]|nr:RagB/SusD family nutrient uptake outer membrane protein [Saprospiraceae bacterium]
MKNKVYLILLLGITTISCNFIDKEPLGLITDPVVWQDPALIDAYLADLYSRVDFIGIGGNNGEQTSHAMIASMGGEGRSFGTHHQSYGASTGVLSSSGIFSELNYWQYVNIRDMNYFLQQIESSPLNASLIVQRSSEVRFLRAYTYFQMLIRWGGVPLITKPQAIDAPAEEIFVSRNSEKEVYDFVINEMTDLSNILPPQNEKGRPSKYAALALKSRAALYAASIAKYGTLQTVSNPTGVDLVLGFPSSDVATYAQISYDASTDIIQNSTHRLYEVLGDPAENFQNLFLDESAANKEVIMAEVYDFSKNRAHAFTMRSTPHDFSNTFATMTFSYNWLERFEFADGKPGTSVTRAQLISKDWAVNEIFSNRDPRFVASVFYPESEWAGGKTYFHKRTIRGGVTYSAGTDENGFPYAAISRNHLRDGFMVRKRTNEKIYPANLNNDDTDYIIFRLGEIYLNLAEAAFYLGKNGEALTALNKVRQRAKMPDKTSINEDIFQNERLVELTWENHSYWDIRRWRIAKKLLNGVRLQGCNFTYIYDTKKYRIQLVNSEGIARTFQDHNYYLPMAVGKTSENPNMVENPGY